ncbi:MAG: dihydropteroate synthase [Syntrophothermus sp.]
MVTSINCNGKVLHLEKPVVMGILNLTPDSFYENSRISSLDELLKKVEQMITDGASILDMGAVSTRPGAAEVSREEELSRLQPALEAVHHHFPEIIISVDTWRSEVAGMALSLGAGMINDISAGTFDPAIISLVIEKDVPFVMMHMQGTPFTMQVDPVYDDVVTEVHDYFSSRISLFPSDYQKLIIDPGFGFGKTVMHNFQLLKHLEDFCSFGVPVLAGLSRKSLIQRSLNIKSAESLNGTTVVNTIALLKGAKILRVHDVKEAMEAIHLVSLLGEAV